MYRLFHFLNNSELKLNTGCHFYIKEVKERSIMHPNHFEIETVGDAFISLSFLDFNQLQRDFLNRFLKDYAFSLDKKELQSLFNNQPEALNAIKVLYEFATQYQDDKETILEFKAEIYDLLINLNGKNEEGISI